MRYLIKIWFVIFFSFALGQGFAQTKQEIKIDLSEIVYKEAKNYKQDIVVIINDTIVEDPCLKIRNEWKQLLARAFISYDFPTYPGGEEAMYQFIGDNLQYPEDCLRDSVEGRVIVHLFLMEEGKVSCVEVLRSLHPSADAEAVRVVEIMPNWILPEGRKGGGLPFTLAIVFKFREEKKEGFFKRLFNVFR